MSEVKNALFPLRCNELKQNGNTQVQEPWSCTCRRVLEWMYFPLCANKSCCSQSIKTTLHQTQKIWCWELDNAFDCDSLKKSTKLNMQTKWIIYKIIYLGFPRRRAGRLIWCFTVQYSRIKDKLSVRMSEKTSHFDFFYLTPTSLLCCFLLLLSAVQVISCSHTLAVVFAVCSAALFNLSH